MSVIRSIASRLASSVNFPDETPRSRDRIDPSLPFGQGRGAHLADNDFEAGAGADLGDPRTHEAGSDDSDPLDRWGCLRPVRPHSSPDDAPRRRATCHMTHNISGIYTLSQRARFP